MRALCVLAALIIVTPLFAQSATAYKDNFSAYPAGSDGDPNWQTYDIGWSAEGGKYVADCGGRAFAICNKVPRGRAQVMEATLTLLEGRGTDWKTAGVALFDDANNYWHLALVEAPETAGKRHFVELQECYKGTWLATSAEGSRLTSLGGNDYSWEYGHPYRLRIELTRDSITGTVSELDGTQRSRAGYKLDNVAVNEGAAALDCGGFRAQFTDFSANVTEAVPAKAAPETAFAPFDEKGSPDIRGKATGYFHVEQIGGRWWLITPKGEGFYAVGTDHANYYAHFCEKLGYAPYSRNCAAEYGNEETWAKSTTDRLKAWNFNAVGCGWSQAIKGKGLPRDEFVAFGQTFAGTDDICPRINWTGFPNVFSPKWPSFCDKRARLVCGPVKNDPWVIGYFLDNELEWFGKNGKQWGLFDETTKKPAEHSGKQAQVAFLKARYPSITAFNAAWGTKFASWDAFARSTDVIETSSKQATEDRMAFVRLVAEKYLSETAKAIRKADPNHLNLGCRFAGYMPDGVIDIAGKYCDIVSVNYYGNVDLDRGISTDMPKVFADYFQHCKRPMMITEWSFPAYDSGLPCQYGAGQRVATQKERAQCWRIYQTTLMSFPFMVGSNYFMWVDEPALGIAKTFPEDSNYGLVDVNDSPWPDLTAMATKVNARVYEIHSGKTAELSVALTPDGKAVTVRNTGGIAADFDLELRVDGVTTVKRQHLGPNSAAKLDTGLADKPGGHFVAAIADPDDTLGEVDRSDNTATVVAYRPGLPWHEAGNAGSAKAAVRLPVVVSNPTANPMPAAVFSQPLQAVAANMRVSGVYVWNALRLVSGDTGEAVPFQVDGTGAEAELCFSAGDLAPYTCKTFVAYLPTDTSATAATFAPALQPRISDTGFEVSTGDLALTHDNASGDLLSEVRLGDQPLGRFFAMMHEQLAQHLWVASDKSESVKTYSGPVRFTADIVVAATQGGGADTKTAADQQGGYAPQQTRPHAFRACYRIAAYPGKPWFSSRLLWVENADREPWQLAGYYHYAPSFIGGRGADAQPDTVAKSLPIGVVAWTNPTVDAFYGCVQGNADDFKMSFWKDEGPKGSEHPDVWREPDVTLAVGQRYEAPQPAAWFFGCKGPVDNVRDIATAVRACNRTKWQAFGVEKK